MSNGTLTIENGGVLTVGALNLAGGLDGRSK